MALEKVLLLAASVLTLSGCGSRISDEQVMEGRDNSRTDVQFEQVSDTVRQQLCGGYTVQREFTEDELAMFTSATSSCEAALTPLSVSTQVVAGTNYRFYCRFEGALDSLRDGTLDEGGNSGHCWVTIFRPLPGQGEPKLVSIK